MIRVVIVDDQAVVRAGFQVVLESSQGIEVVGEAASGPEAVAVVRRTRPDVVLMDVRMPGGGGIDATRGILSDGAGAPAVLVVTTFDLDDYVFGALEAGASGFLLKDAEPDELVDAVRVLAGGGGTLDGAVTRRVVAEFGRRRVAVPIADPEQWGLTPRELDVVRLLAEGRSNDEIAGLLHLATSTVKSHLTRAMLKLGTRDRLQTVVLAYRAGLVGPSRNW